MEMKGYRNICLAKWKFLLEELSNKVINRQDFPSYLIGHTYKGSLYLISNIHMDSPIASPEISGIAFGNIQSMSQKYSFKTQSQDWGNIGSAAGKGLPLNWEHLIIISY